MRKAVIVFVIAAALFSFTISACISSPAMKAVKRERPGRALNDRVCIVYSSHYQVQLGGFEKLHPFDINKYARIYLRLVADGLIRPADMFVPNSVSREDLLRVHSKEYLDRRLTQPHLLAKYLEFGAAKIAPAGLTDAAVLAPFRCATGGTLLAARLALRHGIAINLGGGYHHAEPQRGGGFCIYADMPVAIRTLQEEGLVRRALIVDLDVHQGNGTAVCFEGDDSVFTFDMHEEDIYPIPKETNDLDVPLPAGTDDAEFLAALAEHLPRVFDTTCPDIVFFQAGVDVLEGDPLARFRMSVEGVVKRDRMVFDEAIRRRIPIAMVLGGGYGDQAWYAQYRSIRETLVTYGGCTVRGENGQEAATPSKKGKAR